MNLCTLDVVLQETKANKDKTQGGEELYLMKSSLLI